MSAGRRAWGWHRLTDHWARRLVAEAGVGRDDLVLELGAGTGVLTRHLLATGAQVVAVEMHPGRADGLRRLRESGRLTVVRADAREVRLPHRPFRAVGNLPFAGSNPILRHLLARGTRLVAADLVVQRGLALAARSGTAPGAASWPHRYEVTLRSVPTTAFRPPPRVDVAVLRLRRR